MVIRNIYHIEESFGYSFQLAFVTPEVGERRSHEFGNGKRQTLCDPPDRFSAQPVKREEFCETSGPYFRGGTGGLWTVDAGVCDPDAN
ncbi:hypothetical protein [Pseudosulfitobacter pseudonitzschiae]|uniref:hypothetical protein n=1 Tax=Pseudosulfitobacter pseudonitzschiae TaxID=1402135 RepID=UPI0012FDA9EE|nr:hypothetical protein [Pseudosulfitobacter pseudonitzschiae]